MATWARLGSVFLFLAVALGAFGAHGLKTRLSGEMLAVFETGVRYHVYHALALLYLAWHSTHFQNGCAAGAGWAFTLGIVLFSGSLYALSVTGIKQLGLITPFGGLCFLAGWALLFISTFRSSANPS